MILCIQLYIETKSCQAEPVTLGQWRKRFGVLYKKCKNKGRDFVNILRQKNKNPRSREMAAGI
jgi:hypothetical protein